MEELDLLMKRDESIMKRDKSIMEERETCHKKELNILEKKEK